MALLKGGKIYDIDFKGVDVSSNVTTLSRLKDFVTLYKNVTGITDPNYASLVSCYTPEDGSSDLDGFGIRLPYISKNMEAGLIFFPMEGNNYNKTVQEYSSFYLGVTDQYESIYGAAYEIIPDFWNYYYCNTNYYTIKMNNIDYNHNTNQTEKNFFSNLFFRIDARFLDTHGFYTVNWVYYTGTLQEAYFSPIILVCDMADQIDKNHIDRLISMIDYPEYYPIPDYSYYKTDLRFRPQLYSNQDNSIVLQKLQFGRWKSDTIYLTNASKFNNLEALVNYQQMSTYKDCWLKDRLYSNGKHYIMGVASPQKFDYSIYDGTTAPYIPVISGRGIPEPEPPVVGEPFLRFGSDRDFILSAKNRWNGTIEYSIDEGETWTTWDGNQLTGTNTQDILLRGSNNTKITNGSNSKYCWTFTGKYIKGNIENLLDYQKVANNEQPIMNSYCYGYMFYNCTSLIEAPELPAITLASYCYNGMFYNCSSLTKAPKLPATTLTSYCYQYMFRNCTSLIEAPELLTTTLADSCYSGMFNGCRSLIEAPELPATTLASYCYYTMFYNCSSLTKAPKLPANTLKTYCYYQMFYGCTALIEAPELPATTLASNCYYYMFGNCTLLVKAPKLPANTLKTYCYNQMFYGCTSLIEAPELPATTLETYCYYQMFYGCSSLIEAPELPATTLADSCYYRMFGNCTALTKASELPATTLADSCYSGMFVGCTSLKKAPELSATTLAYSCYSDMFGNCTALIEAPELSATTLADSCYRGMFRGCTSLVSAPKLPATTLAAGCYYQMFYGCSSLIEAPELPATTLADSCYYRMFDSCRSLIEAPELSATTLQNHCYDGMFSYCVSLTNAPKLPATTLAAGCYYSMFALCIALVQIPELPATTLATYCYYEMFFGCTKIKLSSSKTDVYINEYRIPSEGTGTFLGTGTLSDMFSGTGGTFKGTPKINTTYYTSNEVI